MKIKRILLLSASIVISDQDLFAVDSPFKSVSPESSKFAPHPKKRSTEWKKLPRKSWEFNPEILSLQNKEKFIDLRELTAFRQKVLWTPGYYLTQKTIESAGKIVGSKAESNYLLKGDLIFIRASHPLKTGEIYSILEKQPARLRTGAFEGSGSVYPVLGKVKITGTQEDLYIGQIKDSFHPIKRESIIVDELLSTKLPKTIPGPQPIRGKIYLDPNVSTRFLTEHKEAFINRGSEDGIQPGMVFRIYQTRDPVTQDEITKSSFVIDSDLLVLQVSEGFSIALVIRATRPIAEGAEAVLLTDLSELNTKKGFSSKGGDALDELEPIDKKDTIDSKESKTLRQLEKWKDPSGQPPSETPPPPPIPLEGNNEAAPPTPPEGEPQAEKNSSKKENTPPTSLVPADAEPTPPVPESPAQPPAPISETPPAPISETPPAPISETPPAPISETPPAPVSETPPAPVSETPPAPVSETPPAPISKTPAPPTAPADLPPIPDLPPPPQS